MVQDRIKNHVCEECGYATTCKNKMEEHWDAIHNMGDKKFKCEKCPYSSAQKSTLNYHRISTSNIKLHPSLDCHASTHDHRAGQEICER